MRWSLFHEHFNQTGVPIRSDNALGWAVLSHVDMIDGKACFSGKKEAKTLISLSRSSLAAEASA
jgi:hypothetical protein